jgi:uncharacterized protein DUF3830
MGVTEAITCFRAGQPFWETAPLNDVEITIGGETFQGRLQGNLAPQTCRRFLAMLPWQLRLIHARWSGEACWIPLGDLNLQLPLESEVHAPEPGQLLYYPGGIGESEILLPYGTTRFECSAGSLSGTPFLRIYDDLDRLASVGRSVLWQGERAVKFSAQASGMTTPPAASKGIANSLHLR